MAISCGVPPVRAIQMASINTARYFGLKDYGAIAIGFKANFILLDDLNSFTISEVFLDGQRLVDDLNNSTKNKDKTKHGTNLVDTNMVNKIQNSANTHSIISSVNTMHIKSLANPNMFEIVAKQDRKLLNVIGVILGQIITEKENRTSKNIQWTCYSKRAQKPSQVGCHRTSSHDWEISGLGFVQGLGLNKGAIASSVAHDSHNLVVAGMNDIDMMIVARHISSIGGTLSSS